MSCFEITIENGSIQNSYITVQKMKFSVKDFFSKCDQIRRKLLIWSHLLKKSLMKILHFLCSVYNLVDRSRDLTLFREEGRSEELYSQPCQTSKMERFGKIVNRFQRLTIFTKRSILDVLQGCEYASGMIVQAQLFIWKSTFSDQQLLFSKNYGHNLCKI